MQHNTTIFKFIVTFVDNFVSFYLVGGFGLFQVGFGSAFGDVVELRATKFSTTTLKTHLP